MAASGMLDLGAIAEMATVVRCQSSGPLNPDWVEILQGLPIGWIDLECDNPAPWPGWPAPPDMGGQYAYEPPRTATGMVESKRLPEPEGKGKARRWLARDVHIAKEARVNGRAL